MKPVRSLKNQYVGINAHLHSYWQAKGDWSEFHASYIIDLSRTLKVQLLPLGYIAGIEQSLQIRRLDEPDSKPESDLTIYDPDPVRPFIAPKSQVSPGYDLVLALPEVLVDEEDTAEFRAIAIYEANPGEERGQPVAWIELLSPSNKPGGRYARDYRLKRQKLLDSAIVFVEIDYLHESPPTFERIPNYRVKKRDRQANNPKAHPYRILVIDPRPMVHEGKLYGYHFDVDQPLPIVTIPLNDKDKLEFDFGISYHRTVREELFGFEFVDYAQIPLNFDLYSKEDQARITARMLAVLQAADRGIDLETGPFPVQEIALDTALAQLEARKREMHE
ncbi:MAG: DUF4058 family protein [Caldilineaceae bacterium]